MTKFVTVLVDGETVAKYDLDTYQTVSGMGSYQATITPAAKVVDSYPTTVSGLALAVDGILTSLKAAGLMVS